MINKIDILDAGGDLYKNIISPEFHTSEPVIINKDLIPDRIMKLMSPGLFSSVHIQRNINIFLIKDVFITEEGLVITRDGKVISQSITQHNDEEIERSLTRFRKNVFNTIEGKTLLLRKRGDDNYGHWHVEILPKLWLLDGQVDFDNVFLPKSHDEINKVYRDSIALSSYKNYNRVSASKDEVYYAKELFLVDGMTHHGWYMSPLVFSRTDEIVNKLNGNGCRKVFISREGCGRNLNEESIFYDQISKMGFVKINPKEMTYLEQIRYLKDADIVVGVMGAGLTNMMFCKRNTTVISICPSSMPDTFFYLISQLRGLNYVEIRENNLHDVPGWNSKLGWDENTIKIIRARSESF